jgi:hypothetical protein
MAAGITGLAQTVMQKAAGQTLKGNNPNDFSKVQSRHIWSTFYFHSATGGAIQPAAFGGNNPVLQPGTYPVFTTLQQANGQGLPAGFFLDSLDTNWLSAGRVSDDQNFLVTEIGAQILPMRPEIVALSTIAMTGGAVAADDVDKIQRDVILQLKYVTEQIPLGTLGQYAPPCGSVETVPGVLDYAGQRNVTLDGGGMGFSNLAAFPNGQTQQARLIQLGGPTPPQPAMRRRLDVPLYLANSTTFTFELLVLRPTQLRPGGTKGAGGTGAFQVRIDLWVIESYRDNG